MILSDKKIKERILNWELLVESLLWKDIFEQVWPASLDFRLGRHLKSIKSQDKQLLIQTSELMQNM